MDKRMLIDASHPEESRVAILNHDRLEEFDFETTTKKQLKGNIYLAKIIRVEPSLQAAFVDFGGNRHGFLAFNEIHPDYYRIPVEDRKLLLAQEENDITIEEPSQEPPQEPPSKSGVEVLGGDDVEEIEARPRRSRPVRQYKIQEVIKRRQIVLVQVVKEERGGKGAALTTYLSLAGRYCVLMPNATKGGGISRKITNAGDRKRLKEIIESLELPESMSLIIRTAGMARSKVEIKRDSDYLTRLWNDIREKTLHSIAPSLIYEESDLIKRAIRDYYSRDISEIWIEGEAGFKEAKEFIRKLMPSHIKKVKQYTDEKIPLFHRYGVEQQIDTMHNPVVQLKSGGSIVFGTTEALVAIDVNSGKATRERHIEETAVKTNLEAAEEVARQLRLRDLAGLVVIDFIDMEEPRHIESVERRLKDAMRHDRARVQVGRISAFGLLELSRQRLRPNIIESTSLPCPSCRGTGMIRSIESSSLHVLRAIEEEVLQEKQSDMIVHAPTEIALYICNYKRKNILDIEERWKVVIHFSKDDALIPPDYRIERVRLAQEVVEPLARPVERKLPPSLEEDLPEEDVDGEPSPETEVQETASKTEPTRSKPRRRYRKFDRRPQRHPENPQEEGQSLPPPHVVDSTPILNQESLPKEEHGKEEHEKAEKSPAQVPPARKKAAPRKGWWQRLLE